MVFKHNFVMPDGPFHPGVDAGLKTWLKIKEDLRESARRGKTHETIPLDIKYGKQSYWSEKALLNEEVRPEPPNSIKGFEELLANEDNFVANLITALVVGHVRFLQCVLKDDEFDVYQQIDNYGHNIFHFLALRGDLVKLKIILEHGQHTSDDINRQDNSGNTPLQLAIQKPITHVYHSHAIIELLLQHSANVNVQNYRGFTALHQACLLGDILLIKLLLAQESISVYILDKKDKTPIEYCKHKQSAEICECFTHTLREALKPKPEDEESKKPHKKREKVAPVLSAAQAKQLQFMKVAPSKLDVAPPPSNEPPKMVENKVGVKLHADYTNMWAHIMSRTFMKSIFMVALPTCIKCKRKQKDCETLKLQNYRHWLLVHNKIPRS